MTADFNQERQRPLALGLIALLIAGGTALMAYRVVEGYHVRLQEATQPGDKVRVVRAVAELPAGVPIEADSVQLFDVPEEALLGEGYFVDIEEVVGRIPGERILPGEEVRVDRLAVGSKSVQANAIITPGTRAVTVKVDRAPGVGGLLEPGFYVDVIVTIKPEKNSLQAEWVTETILQQVRVLAVGTAVGEPDSRLEEGDAAARSRRDLLVTLEVDPEEAEKVAMATNRGKLHLTLRAIDDYELIEQRGPLVTNALVGLSEPATKTQSRRRTRTTAPKITTQRSEVIQGGKVSGVEFDDAGNKVLDDRKR
ncbi:MAG: Flp pilus assembly protein CpaB [Alphaproteobacteria bacterium]|nr:Flp pilus assembly protein CpaB [Alphaproteobacteria bacterium]MCB9796651.1 Flp pilus assembly protein CpaB [Alphaproteobacteria bacterium]